MDRTQRKKKKILQQTTNDNVSFDIDLSVVSLEVYRSHTITSVISLKQRCNIYFCPFRNHSNNYKLAKFLEK